MNEEIVNEFEKVQAQLESTYDEICTLSKKSPNDGVNKFKLGIVNKILLRVNEFLGEDYIPVEGFSEFNEEDVPTNSDVVFICSQYLSCMEKLRADNIKNYHGRWVWVVDGEISSIVTKAPKKIRNK